MTTATLPTRPARSSRYPKDSYSISFSQGHASTNSPNISSLLSARPHQSDCDGGAQCGVRPSANALGPSWLSGCPHMATTWRQPSAIASLRLDSSAAHAACFVWRIAAANSWQLLSARDWTVSSNRSGGSITWVTKPRRKASYALELLAAPNERHSQYRGEGH